MKTHGMSGTRLCKCYGSMKDRCKRIHNWADKGILVCDEWLSSPESFFKWALENGYNDSLTLDRIDPLGNYEPSNCRWITKQQQQNNRTNNRYITINGATKTMADWARFAGIPYSTIQQRVKIGYFGDDLIKPKGSIRRATNKPTSKYSRYSLITIDGETKTIKEWSNASGISSDTIVMRVLHGWDESELLSPPKNKRKRSVKTLEQLG